MSDLMDADLTHPPLTEQQKRKVVALVRARFGDQADIYLDALGLKEDQ